MSWWNRKKPDSSRKWSLGSGFVNRNGEVIMNKEYNGAVEITPNSTLEDCARQIAPVLLNILNTITDDISQGMKKPKGQLLEAIAKELTSMLAVEGKASASEGTFQAKSFGSGRFRN